MSSGNSRYVEAGRLKMKINMKRKDYISPTVLCRPVQCLNMLATSGVPAVSDKDAGMDVEVFSNQNQFGELW